MNAIWQVLLALLAAVGLLALGWLSEEVSEFDYAGHGRKDHFHVPLLESNHFRFMRKCRNRCGCILKIKNFCITIICGIHFLQTRICIQHGLSCFHTIILYQFASHTDPFTTLKSTDLSFRIGM